MMALIFIAIAAVLMILIRLYDKELIEVISIVGLIIALLLSILALITAITEKTSYRVESITEYYSSDYDKSLYKIELFDDNRQYFFYTDNFDIVECFIGVEEIELDNNQIKCLTNNEKIRKAFEKE